ncbi:hypothetical protein [Agromyces lapidis]|uniref:Uncharacterized protein n=1 Tax=Agromyces lapidis TaxID=279574 RepID=A0ABV5SUS9_9MICO|nr:hypothetical protein [Agromyces lapidis]
MSTDRAKRRRRPRRRPSHALLAVQIRRWGLVAIIALVAAGAVIAALQR